MIEEFKEISISGRVAFGIHCLQRAFARLGYGQPILQLLIEYYTEFVNVQTLDNDWHAKTQESMPCAILEGSSALSTKRFRCIRYGNCGPHTYPCRPN